jgi:glycosyltransferase involved in cell wall biosynthesis
MESILRNVESAAKPTISVIICAYTEARWNEMLAAVESLKNQTHTAHEIILIIDHNPALFERTRARLKGVTVVENREQQGLSGARNSGLAITTGDIIAFMDEDAAAAPDWLARLAVCYEDAQVMGAGGAIEPKWQSGRPNWFPEEFDWVVGCTYRGMPAHRAPVRNLIGCNMSFRQQVYELSGGFRSGIGRIGTRPLGCEETEFCIRANQHFPEQHFVYEPAARVYHHVPDSRANWNYFRSRCYSEGLSKALVASFVGASSGLSSEKTYVARTLPQGVLRGMTATLLRFDRGGVGRAGAIVAGLFLTGLGYLVGTAALTLRQGRSSAEAPELLPAQQHEL